MRIFLALAFCTTALAAQAEQLYDGFKLLADCKSNRAAVEAYIAGWHDKREVDGYFSQMATKDFEHDQTAKIIYESVLDKQCLPQKPDLGEMTNAVCDYVAAHERQHFFKGIGLVSMALKEKYPCR